MQIKPYIIIFFATALCLSQARAQTSQQTPTTTFNLQQTLSYAVEHSPAFDSLKRQVDIRTLEEKSAFARMLPSLDLRAVHGVSEVIDPEPINDNPWASSMNLGLTESLYDNHVSITNHRIAKLQKQRAELAYKDQLNDLSLDVAEAFLQYSLNVKLLEIQEQQYKLVSRQYESISKSYYQGMKTKKDFLRFKTQVSRNEIDLVNARNNIEKSKQEIKRLMGVRPDDLTNFQFLPFSLENIKWTLPSSELRVEDHLRYRSAEMAKQVNSLSSDLVNRQYWPEVFVTAGLNYASEDYMGTGARFEDRDQLSWNALLTLRYNLFDWGIRARNAQVANQTRMIQNNSLDSEILGLNAQMNQLKINIGQVQRNFDLAKELLSLEKDNVNLIQSEYRNGNVSYLDLITGIQASADAQYKYYTSAAELQISQFTLLYHQGKLYENILP